MNYNPNPPPPRSTPPNPYPRNPYANPAPRTHSGGHYARPSGQRPGKKKVPVWVWIIVGFFAVGLIATWTAKKSDGGISKLDLHYTVDDSYSLEVGESVEDYLTVSGKDNFPVDSIEFISSNPSVVAFAFVNTADEKVYFSIDALAPGTATLYAQTTDGVIKSDEIAVSVEPSPTPEPTPEPTPSPTPEPTATPEPTEEPEQEDEANGSTDGYGYTDDSEETTGYIEEPETQSETVWLSRSGNKYHSTPNCGNMKDPIPSALNDALQNGREPCSKCW